MREKRLRKQEMEEQDKTSAEADPSQKQTADWTLNRKAPAKDSLTSPGSSSPSSTTLTPDTQKLSVRKLIPLNSKAASSLNSTTTPGTTVAAITAVTSVPVKQSSSQSEGETESHSQSASSSSEVPDKNTRNSTALSPAKQSRAAPQGPTEEAPTADKTLNNNQKKSPEHTTDTKGTSPLMLVIHSSFCNPHFYLSAKATHLGLR